MIPKSYENIAEVSKQQVASTLACSNFQFDKLKWNNLRLRTFNSSFSNVFFTNIFMISSEEYELKVLATL
ncbi:hypothetical protein [Clostridium beijerinckii]|uniref:hypothetical protein n=1 Tax=Clostridium beijerinckii TaxID=1520 RepID=UPI001965F56D|nr:hypothetical protein [Clostridium beijerinckii]